MEAMTARHEHCLGALLHVLHADGASGRLQLILFLLSLEQGLRNVALRLYLLLHVVLFGDAGDLQFLYGILAGPIFLLLALILFERHATHHFEKLLVWRQIWISHVAHYGS